MNVAHVSLFTDEHRREAAEYLEKFFGEPSHAIGVLKGYRRMFSIVLAERGIPLDAHHRRMLMDCTDPDQLTHWFKRALVATSPADVFE